MSPSEQQAASGFGDQAVDVRRYAETIRRGAPVIVLAALFAAVLVVAISSALPKTYDASARLVYNPTASVLAPTSGETSQRQLATFQAFVQAPTVIASASKRLGESSAAVKESISASAEGSANILTISASARKPSVAAIRANAVARAFVSEEEAMQNRGFETARAQLESEIAALRGSPNTSAQIAALESRISELQISATGTQTELQLAELASPPGGPASPRVALNGLIAFVVALILTMLAVLGRDQLRPRFSRPRELGDALGVPVLARIPYRQRMVTQRSRRALQGLEVEAYDLLQTAIRLLGLPDGVQRTLLISSARPSEGKTTVTANLGRSLARNGQRTLLISGDLRSPKLDERFGLPAGPGLADCLRIGQSDPSGLAAAVASAIRPVPEELNLDLMVAGETPSDPGSLLSSPLLEMIFESVHLLGYAYVLVDSPPLLGIADAQLLARQAEEVLVVARLDRVSPDQVEDLRELLDRLKLSPVGLAIVGAKVEFAPYYDYTNERRVAAT